MMKIYIIVVVLAYGVYWIGSKNVHSPYEALDYAKKHPDPKWSPMIEYYVGSYYFHRDEPGKAQEAFMQLLTDYTTSQYEEAALSNLTTASEDLRDWPIAKGAAARYLRDFPQGKYHEVVAKQLELDKYNHGADVEIYPPDKE